MRKTWITAGGVVLVSGVLTVLYRYLYILPKNDPIDEVHRAQQACEDKKSRTQFIVCVREQLEAGIARMGMRTYMDALSEVFTRESNDVNRCHDIAHVVGQVGAQSARGDVQLISDCTASICGDGCFHGYLEGYVASGGDVSGAVSTLCQPIAERDVRSRWACFHGLGHGIAGLTGSDDQALANCDEIKDAHDRRNCGAGVLMEFYLSPSTDRAALPLPQDFDDYCQNLHSEYRDICVVMSGSIVYEHTRDDGEASAVCARLAPESNKQQCVMKLAGVWYNEERTDVQSTLNRCKRLTDDFSRWCILGAVEESVLSGGFSQAREFCSGITEKGACFRFLGDTVAYGFGEEERKNVCGVVFGSDAEACLSGAAAR